MRAFFVSHTHWDREWYRTFEDFRGFWPHQTDDATGITDYLNTVDKYVVSSTMTDPAQSLRYE